MCKSKLGRALFMTIDKYVPSFDNVKLFGHPVEDFEIDKMSKEDRRLMKKALKKKLDKLSS